VGPDVRWIVRHFLAELEKVDLRDTNPPLHILNYRLALADMLLTEVDDTDLECIAVRALAERIRDLCLTPGSLDAMGRRSPPGARTWKSSKGHTVSAEHKRTGKAMQLVKAGTIWAEAPDTQLTKTLTFSFSPPTRWCSVR